MGNRLSKIVTKTGDQGETGLADGSRISKGHLLIEAIGSVDETLSALGLTISQINADNTADEHAISTTSKVTYALQEIQHRLFDLGGELAWPEGKILQEEDVEQLEVWIETFNENLPPLKNFILPGGSLMVAQCHMARALCRKTERDLIRLNLSEENNAYPVRPVLLRYINRLSDLLFIAARTLANTSGNNGEILWKQKK
jgi:cob(I)alamin adenosyltransferase